MLWLWLQTWGCLLLFGLSLLSWAPPLFSSWSCNSFLWTQLFYSVLAAVLSPYTSTPLIWPLDPLGQTIRLPNICPCRLPPLEGFPRGYAFPAVLTASCHGLLPLCPHERTPGHGSLCSLDSHLDYILIPSWSHPAPDTGPALLHGRGKGDGFKAIHILRSYGCLLNASSVQAEGATERLNERRDPGLYWYLI